MSSRNPPLTALRVGVPRSSATVAAWRALRRLGRTIWRALEDAGRARAAHALRQAADRYELTQPELARRLRAASLRHTDRLRVE